MKYLVFLGLTLLLVLLVYCGDDGPTCSRPGKPTPPRNPTPSKGASDVPSDAVLSWEGGECTCGIPVIFDVYLAGDTQPPLISGTCSTRTFDPGGLDKGAHYFWRVVARSEIDSTIGEVWDFQVEEACTRGPSAPCGPYPGNAVAGVPVDTVLTWKCCQSICGYEVTYDVYFGPTLDPPLVCSGCSSKVYDPGPLDYSTHYYWKVVATDSAGSTPGPWWIFTTRNDPFPPPTRPCNPDPSMGAAGLPLETDLSWECGESRLGYPVTYDVYFGTGAEPSLVSASSSERTYDPGPLLFGMQYYWKVVASDSAGSTIGELWAFITEKEPCETPPMAPCGPTPAHASEDLPVDADLSWNCGESMCGFPVTYDVYFGTNETPPLVCSGCIAKAYDPGTLQTGTLYYWRVVVSDSAGSSPGELWAFTTEEEPCEIAPTAPCDPVPAPSAVDVKVDAGLSWGCGESMCDHEVVYVVYLGTSADPPMVCSGCVGKTFDPGTLDNSTEYFWRVVAVDHAGETPGDLWTFTTEADSCAPTAPCNPVPASGTGMYFPVNTDLSWECGESMCGQPVTYDVYFGTKGDLSLLCSDLSERTCDPGPLEMGVKYYWRVVAKTAGSSTVGDTWRFTVGGRSWYIRPDGTGDVPTISAGVDSAGNADTLLLADGVFSGPDNRGIYVGDGSLVIRSESGNPEECVIDCEHAGDGVTFGSWTGDVYGRVEGIKITGAGTGVRADLNSGVQVVDCIITDCSGVAVTCSGQPAQGYSWLGLSSCEISSNPGGAMYCGYKCGINATNCVFFANTFAAQISERAHCSFDRCTIVGNGGGIISVGSPNGVGLRQSILAFNTGIPVTRGSSPCDVGADCCNIFGNTGGDYVECLAGMNGVNGNFSLDPAFCDLTGVDFRPRADSPCAEGNHPDGADCGRIGAFASGCD